MLLLMSGWLELWLIYEFMDLFLDCGFMDLFLVESLERSSVITCRWKSLSTMFLLLSKLLGPVLPVATVTVCTLLDSITLLNTRTMNTTRVSTARKLAVSYTKVFVLEVEGMNTCLLTLISDSSSSSAPFSIASAMHFLWKQKTECELFCDSIAHVFSLCYGLTKTKMFWNQFLINIHSCLCLWDCCGRRKFSTESNFSGSDTLKATAGGVRIRHVSNVRQCSKLRLYYKLYAWQIVPRP